MSIDYKRIYENVVELQHDLIYELGKCYLSKKPTERVFCSFVNNLYFLLFPNSILTEDKIPVMEHSYAEIK